MAASEKWVQCMEYLAEHSKADKIILEEEEDIEENYDEEGNYYGPERGNSLLLIWDTFFRGKEANDANNFRINFNYGVNGNYAGNTYGCGIMIETPQVSINETIVQSSAEKLIEMTLERLEVYTETLNLGYRRGDQPDNSRLSYFCQILRDCPI